MLNFIVEFLSTRVAPNNTVLQFLKTILESSILGRMATGLFTLFVMAFFSWAYYKRNKEDYASLTGDSDIWGVCSKSFGYWMGITVILLAFQTNFAFDIFLSFIDLFSDWDSEKAGLKFMFGYDTKWVLYPFFSLATGLLTAGSFFYALYNGILYFLIHKGTETLSKDGTSTNFISFRRAAISCFVLIVIFYSILPEWIINSLISTYSDKTLYEIMTTKKAP